ncbi:MAG TPA: porin [Kofleriaceae bacterium]|nr:porin [Kofleriaceae bacterium]
MRRIVAIACAAPAAVARAGGGPPTDAYDGIAAGAALDVHGFADIYGADNLDDPKSGQSQLRAFDPTANAPALGWLRLRVAHAPGTVGFRVDLGLGDTATGYFLDDPARVAHPELSRWLSHVGQAFVTVVAPHAIAIDAGKFDTPIGLEDNEGLANWNYSRSFVYTWDEPSLHTGVRATYEVSKQVAVAAYWLNGWGANVLDGSDMRSYAVTARYKPSEELEAVIVYAGGLERAPANPALPLAWRDLIDGYVTYAVTPALAIAATGDYTAQFAGAAGYARYALPAGFALAARGERLWDHSGLATGTAQTLDEATATVEDRGTVHGATIVGRLEYRHDHSTADVFEHGEAFLRTQDTIAVGLIASY